MSDDPFTMSMQLCDDDGIVRGGAMHHGRDYPCTGHAHFAGEHIECSGPSHSGQLPAELRDLLNDPFVELARDTEVWPLLAHAAPVQEGEADG